MEPTYDVFLSYHHADADLAQRLVGALRSERLSVFFDQSELQDFKSITDQLTAGLARSKALVALYSATYPVRRACQFELTAAFLASEREGDPRRRVMVVNPTDSVEHIQPVELTRIVHEAGAAPMVGAA